VADKPIIFKGPMVCGILEGRKTQTRRISDKQDWPDGIIRLQPRQQSCVPYKIGDRLWVRENCRAEELESGDDGVRYMADNGWIRIENNEIAAIQWTNLLYYRSDITSKRQVPNVGAKVPSIHMPTWASRLTLIVADVRVQRLQDISEEDALAEGVVFDAAKGFIVPGIDHPDKDFPYLSRTTAREMFAALWDVVNGSGAWCKNPFVVAVSFNPHKQNILAMGAAHG
jgi:hypothetical protein